MTIEADEASVQASRPREGYEITLPNGVPVRLASADTDLIIGGNLFRASPIRRGELEQSTGDDETLEIMLPTEHPIVQRYLG